MIAKKIYTILKFGTKAEQLALLNQMPANSMKKSAKSLVSIGDSNMIMLAFGTLLTNYVHGANCAVGDALGAALYKYSKELFDSGQHPNILFVIDSNWLCFQSCTCTDKFRAIGYCCSVCG